VAEGVRVQATPNLEVALGEFLENAFEHGDGAKQGVEIRAHSDGGPEIPEEEWEILAGEREQTQLEHATGLGLWVVESIAESFGGELRRVDRKRLYCAPHRAAVARNPGTVSDGSSRGWSTHFIQIRPGA
jgi:signal transduction histidine kinase